MAWDGLAAGDIPFLIYCRWSYHAQVRCEIGSFRDDNQADRNRACARLERRSGHWCEGAVEILYPDTSAAPLLTTYAKLPL